MKKMVFLSFMVIFFFNSYISLGQTRVSPEDLDPIIGNWSGSLTYLDYSSGKPYTMPAELKAIKPEGTNNYKINFSYPDEPGANSETLFSISEDGSILNDEKVISKLLLENGNLEIITEATGTDGNDNKPATFRHTYILGKDVFVIRKDVLFAEENNWIKRNEFSFKRIR